MKSTGSGGGKEFGDKREGIWWYIRRIIRKKRMETGRFP